MTHCFIATRNLYNFLKQNLNSKLFKCLIIEAENFILSQRKCLTEIFIYLEQKNLKLSFFIIPEKLIFRRCFCPEISNSIMLAVEIICWQCFADEMRVKARFEGFSGDKVVLHNCVFQCGEIQGPQCFRFYGAAIGARSKLTKQRIKLQREYLAADCRR